MKWPLVLSTGLALFYSLAEAIPVNQKGLTGLPAELGHLICEHLSYQEMNQLKRACRSTHYMASTMMNSQDHKALDDYAGILHAALPVTPDYSTQPHPSPRFLSRVIQTIRETFYTPDRTSPPPIPLALPSTHLRPVLEPLIRALFYPEFIVRAMYKYGITPLGNYDQNRMEMVWEDYPRRNENYGDQHTAKPENPRRHEDWFFRFGQESGVLSAQFIAALPESRRINDQARPITLTSAPLRTALEQDPMAAALQSGHTPFLISLTKYLTAPGFEMTLQELLPQVIPPAHLELARKFLLPSSSLESNLNHLIQTHVPRAMVAGLAGLGHLQLLHDFIAAYDPRGTRHLAVTNPVSKGPEPVDILHPWLVTAAVAAAQANQMGVLKALDSLLPNNERQMALTAVINLKWWEAKDHLCSLRSYTGSQCATKSEGYIAYGAQAGRYFDNYGPVYFRRNIGISYHHYGPMHGD
ncbi:hypothetical protein IWQ60_001810 [Tieghemiomyces parasiticus]|uniref:F-box domain-containing protein n=1 Tax=Tieghemiomyces parasiticus TaxID=78921 RepID=A0A9W8E1K4_9FUNG|nr:hypothetical protein IWQ60_001810 [Tieghemiomyces parasiticus]